MNREAVASALASLMCGAAQPDGTFDAINMNDALAAAGYKTFGRRLVLWTQVDVSDKPALFLVNYDEEHDRKNIYGPDTRTMKFMFVIYDDVSDPVLIPSTRMNMLLDGIDTAFRNAVDKLTDRLTLGGLVQHVWIEGTAKVSPGDLDSQSVAVYPVMVLCP